MTDISTNVVLVAYSFDAIIPYKIGDTKIERRIKEINNFHYLTFTRGFKFGGAMTFDTFGVVRNINPGDWVVALYTAKGKIRGKISVEEIQAEKPQPIFIGQVFSKTLQDFADADGNKRVTTQIVVREWTHVFTMPFMLDQLNIIVSSSSKLTNLSEQTGIDLTEIFSKVVNTPFDPFAYAEFALTAIGALGSGLNFSSIKELENRPNVNQRLPVIPKELFDDWISPEPINGKIVEFDPIAPWSTGFFATAFGVWGSDANSNDAPKTEELVWSNQPVRNILKLSNGNRPSALKSVFTRNQEANNLFFSGSIIDQITENFGEFGTAYEMYGDIIFDKETGKCRPTLFLRDKPMTFDHIWQGNEKDEKQFKWTKIDRIPRTTIPSENVLTIISTFNFQGAYNFSRINLSTSVYQLKMAQGAATRLGTRINLPSQDRFGTISLNQGTTVYPLNRQAAEQAGLGEKSNEVSVGSSWLEVLSLKYINYYAYKYLFPECVVTIKNAQYPLTVGMAVRIPQSRGGLTIVGLIQDIRFDVKTEEGSLINSSTIVTLSDVGYEKTEYGRIMPLPRTARDSLQVPEKRIPVYEFLEMETAWAWTDGQGEFRPKVRTNPASNDTGTLT